MATNEQKHALAELVRAHLALEQAKEDMAQAMTPGAPYSRAARAAVHAADVLACQHDDVRDISDDELCAILDRCV